MIVKPAVFDRRIGRRPTAKRSTFFGRPPQFSYIILDPFFGLVIMRKAPFVAAKSGRVVITSAIVMNGWMRDMQHLVEEHVLNYEPRHRCRIKRAAYRDRVVGGVVMAQDVIALSRRPGQRGFFQTPAKIPKIQLVKHLVQIINLSPSPSDDLLAPCFFRRISSFLNCGRLDVAFVSVASSRRRFSSE